MRFRCPASSPVVASVSGLHADEAGAGRGRECDGWVLGYGAACTRCGHPVGDSESLVDERVAALRHALVAHPPPWANIASVGADTDSGADASGGEESARGNTWVEAWQYLKALLHPSDAALHPLLRQEAAASFRAWREADGGLEALHHALDAITSAAQAVISGAITCLEPTTVSATLILHADVSAAAASSSTCPAAATSYAAALCVERGVLTSLRAAAERQYDIPMARLTATSPATGSLLQRSHAWVERLATLAAAPPCGEAAVREELRDRLAAVAPEAGEAAADATADTDTGASRGAAIAEGLLDALTRAAREAPTAVAPDGAGEPSGAGDS